MYPHRREIEGDFIPRTEGGKGDGTMEPEAGMRQHEAWSADCLQQVEEAGADSHRPPEEVWPCRQTPQF